MHGLGLSFEEYKKLVANLSGLKASMAGSSFETTMDQIAAGASVDIMGDIFNQFDEKLAQNKGVLRRAINKTIKRLGGTLSTKSIGIAMTQTFIRTEMERRVVQFSSNLLKLPFRAISRGSNVLSLVALFGTALDLLSAFVYNPYRRYEYYMSDRMLNSLAQAELVTTQRLIGRQRLLLEPAEWMVNSKHLDHVIDSTYDLFLGMTYTRARRVNSEGSLIYWYKYGGLQSKTKGELDYFNQVTSTAIQNDFLDYEFYAEMNNKMHSNRSRKPDVLYQCKINRAPMNVDRPIAWYVMCVFVLIAAISLVGLASASTTYRIFPFAVLATIVSVTFPIFYTAANQRSIVDKLCKE